MVALIKVEGCGDQGTCVRTTSAFGVTAFVKLVRHKWTRCI